MYTWVTKAESKISNFQVAATSEKHDMEEFVRIFKNEGAKELLDRERKLLENLKDYFKQPEGHVYLVEGYREEFSNSIKSLRQQTERSVFNQLTAAAEIKQGKLELHNIRQNHTKEMEKAVRALIDKCRKKNVEMTDTELEKEFEKTWKKTVNSMSFSGQKPSNIFGKVSDHLRRHLSQKGSYACKLVSEESLRESELESFKYTPDGFIERTKQLFRQWFKLKDPTKVRQQVADSIISASIECVSDKMKRKSDYHETYIEEIFQIIDEKLNNVDSDTEFEVSLKQHICGFAAKMFQKMHEDFIQENDPHTLLLQSKKTFCANFKAVFSEQDQCQKKAVEFTNKCLQPAVEKFIYSSLGPDIVDEMEGCGIFKTRMSFKYEILLDLILNEQFYRYNNYVCSNTEFVKSWIEKKMKEHFSNKCKLSELEAKHIKSSLKSIDVAILDPETQNAGSLKTFVEIFLQKLDDKLVIDKKALDDFMILNNADQKQFALHLTKPIKDIAETLKQKFEKTTFETKVQHLNMNPVNVLLNKVNGCGKQCPFCAEPCEATGVGHTEHFALLHRPQAFGQYRNEKTEKLVTDICTSLVSSDWSFSCNETNGVFQPYKSYKDFFPDWHIPPDKSLDASDYWKYVLTKYNQDLAKAYNAKLADVPSAWKDINQEKAKASLRVSFNKTN
ncbi:hypothetical protein AMECASPLE_015974 [Ameca splendens]|uniref:Interferon-induced very large GTPase 1 domain-containing protein n=1 Tax=Ameca splendens TaxID=208324 RepID=A0ABV0Y1Y1_9TELE